MSCLWGDAASPSLLTVPDSTHTTTPSTLRLGGVPEHFNLPWHLAIESAELADLDLTWEDQFGGTGEMLEKLADGSLDVVSILTEGTVKAIDAGLAVTMVQIYVSSPLQWGVFVPAQSTYRDESELSEARVAISRYNSGSHLMAYVHAERLGWKINPDRFVVVGGLDGAAEALSGGQADLFLWEQFMTRPLVRNGTFRQLAVQPTPWPSFVIAARNEVLTGRTTELGRVVDQVMLYAADYVNRPDRIELVTSRYGIDAEAAQQWFASTTFAPRQPMDSTIAGTVRETLQRLGVT